MKFVFRKLLLLMVTVGMTAWPCGSSWAQTTDSSAATSNSPAAGPVGPPPLPPKSPVDSFRELLGMTNADRQRAISNRPPEVQKRILEKVREYQAMDAKMREVRLQLTELHFYLLPLMKTPPAKRGSLTNIPEDDRKLIEARLQEWDKLSAGTQKQLLENYATIRWLEGGAEPPKPGDMANVAPALQPGLRRWQDLSEEQRQTIVRRFNQFFDLTTVEKQRVFGTLSEPERKQIEKTLSEFAKLNATQRAQCLASFQKFANLAPEERREFLKTAERWKMMTADQRQAWKDLIKKLPPPLPGADTPPPMPPAAGVQPTGTPFATNSN
jgi:hypothetical protein